MPKPNIIIYTDRLLPKSETFIRNPAMALENYTPYFVGSRRVDGLPLPEDRTIVANGSGLMSKVKQYSKLLLLGTNGVASLAAQLAPIKPLFIQAHYGPSGVNAMPLAKALDVPLLVYYHGIDATMTDEHAQQRFYTRHYLKHRDELKAYAHLFLAQSNFLRDTLIKQGFPAEKIITHYVGAETRFEEPRPLHEREQMVLFVGRFVEKKGVTYLIEAMSKVQAKHPEMKLVLVGDGELREALEEQAKNSLKNYEFVGWQTPQQVMEWNRKARIFCAPSVTAASGDSEGFGMVFAEAQSVGLPVVSFAHGGIPEAVAHEETGLLAPERDTDTLADYLLRLLSDDALWNRFSKAGPARVKRMIDLRTQALGLEKIYETHMIAPEQAR